MILLAKVRVDPGRWIEAWKREKISAYLIGGIDNSSSTDILLPSLIQSRFLPSIPPPLFWLPYPHAPGLIGRSLKCIYDFPPLAVAVQLCAPYVTAIKHTAQNAYRIELQVPFNSMELIFE